MTQIKSGLCQGVSRALTIANSATGRKVYMVGDIINNRHVMDEFTQKGFTVTEDLSEIEPDATVIVRAHGLPKAAYEHLQNAEILDCTCPKVKKIHNIVEKAPGRVIIVGTKTHPEVIGTLGWCKDGIVVESFADIKDIPENVVVVGQTTCKQNLWDEITSEIMRHNPAAIIHNTLCSAVQERITEAVEIAKKVDVVVCVGDKKSANSTALFNTCKMHNANTYFVSDIEDIDLLENVTPDEAIAFIGSASAPVSIVEKVHDLFCFQKFLQAAKTEIENFPYERNHHSPIIKEAIHDLFEQNEGGKRLRGALIKLGALAETGTPDGYLPVAYAYELFQTAILIHDDIIDRSHQRRGKTTIHTKKAAVSPLLLAEGSGDCNSNSLQPKESDTHFGLSRAICIGDYGLFLANKIMAGAIGGNTLEALSYFADIQLATLEGETLDVTLPYRPINPKDEYDRYMDTVLEIYLTKTAVYSLAGPLKLGAIFAGASNELAEALFKLAVPLGIAFQIKDDLLGMYGEDKTIGKPAVSDLLEKKQTLIYGYAYKHATDGQRILLDELYGKTTATAEDLVTVREIFTATGAKTFAENNIRRLSGESLQAIETLNTTDTIKSLLKGLVYYQTARRF